MFIDVFYWEGNIDWNVVKVFGILVVYVKVIEGVNYIDFIFIKNV